MKEILFLRVHSEHAVAVTDFPGLYGLF